MTDPFYTDLGDGRFVASSSCAGPWDPRHQHGGPPAALLAHAIDRCAQRDDMRVARFTAEILGPVPVGELAVQARVTRAGRSVELVEAELSADGRTAMRAAAWLVLEVPRELDPVGAPSDVPAIPDDEASFAAAGWHDGYLSAIEWRAVAGSVTEPGPATVWTRMRAPLIDGRPTSGLERALVVADAGNGISSSLDLRVWWFINPELTVHLTRPPDGEWICVDARTTIEPGGAGLAETTLVDAGGRFGVGAQSLLVARRPGADHAS